MEIITKSGEVKVNKASHYGKWLIGYMTTSAWSGWYTIERVWNTYKDKKPKGCSWTAWGVICGEQLVPLKSEINDLLEEVGRL